MVIQEALETISDLLEGRHLTLRAEVAPDLPLLQLDRARIRQVLINLLNNAARFTETGTVLVRAEVVDGEAVVSVTDTGIGIPSQELIRIFDEFHQVDMSLRRRKEGAGLGLAISKRFVELHGGRIWAESQLGRGSTFSFVLPLTPEAPVTSSLRQTRRLTPAPAPEGVTLVVIDPDPAVGETLRRYLGDYRILQCAAPGEAVALVEAWQPRAVVLNLSPDEEHLELLREASARLPAHLPVLGCSLPSQSWMARQRGVSGCLTKPVSRQALLDALARVYATRALDGARRVLVVDDDRHFVQLVARYLESVGGWRTPDGGYRVSWAYEGQEALERIGEAPPDVILLDLVMPGLDGFALLQVLQGEAAWREIPVIIVTATDFSLDLVHRRGGLLTVARGQGFSPSEVIAHLKALLQASQTVSLRQSVNEASN